MISSLNNKILVRLFSTISCLFYNIYRIYRKVFYDILPHIGEKINFSFVRRNEDRVPFCGRKYFGFYFRLFNFYSRPTSHNSPTNPSWRTASPTMNPPIRDKTIPIRSLSRYKRHTCTVSMATTNITCKTKKLDFQLNSSSITLVLHGSLYL